MRSRLLICRTHFSKRSQPRLLTALRLYGAVTLSKNSSHVPLWTPGAPLVCTLRNEKQCSIKPKVGEPA